MSSNEEPTGLLQAVVLLDAFNPGLLPFSRTKPSCLLPLANVPLLEYTLDFLARNGLQEVFLYTQGSTGDDIDDYLQGSRWLRSSAPFKLQIIRSMGTSVGHAMRDIDARMKLNQHFIVVYGNVLGNFNLYQALEDHKARRKSDANTMMTILLRESLHSIRRAPTSPVFINSAAKKNDDQKESDSGYDGGRVMHYDERQLPADESSDESCSDPEYDSSDDEDEEEPELKPVRRKGRGVAIPHELVLTQSLDVRNDLVDCGVDICTPDVLAIWTDNPDFETHRMGFLQSTLKDYELNGKKIHSHIIKPDYLSPLRSLEEYRLTTSDFLCRKAYPLCPNPGILEDQRYQEKSPHAIYVAKNAATISSSAKLNSFCIVGEGSRVGKRCYVRDSVIGRTCKIGDGCILDGAILWDGVTVNANTTIINSVINGGVSITGRDEVIDRAVTSIDEEGNLLSVFEATMRAESSESLASKTEQFTKEAAGPPSPKPPTGKNFVLESTSNIFDSLNEGHDATTIHLELQAFRMAMNADEHEVRVAIGTALVQHLERGNISVPEALSRLKLVIERSVFDTAKSLKSDQVDFLLVLQGACRKFSSSNGGEMLFKISKHLYSMDLEEERFDDTAFLQWWEDPRSQGDEEMRKVRAKTEELIQICASTSDEEDEDEDEDEDDE
ncbi:MAG: hypothetical protein M1831_006026 [Alyxoria varia]|nr:MAG: hypothetical protein M1831_006026 [Alyxoria varia]